MDELDADSLALRTSLEVNGTRIAQAETRALFARADEASAAAGAILDDSRRDVRE